MPLYLTINGQHKAFTGYPYSGFDLPTQNAGALSQMTGQLSLEGGGSPITFTRIKADNRVGNCARLKVHGVEITAGWQPFTKGTITSGGASVSFTIDYGAWGTIGAPSGLMYHGAQWGRWVIEYTQDGQTKTGTFEIGGLVRPATLVDERLSYEEFSSRWWTGYSNNGAIKEDNPLGMNGGMKEGFDSFFDTVVKADHAAGVRKTWIWYPYGRTGEHPGHPQPSDIDFDNKPYSRQLYPDAPENRWWNEFKPAMIRNQAELTPPMKFATYLGTMRSAKSFHDLLEASNGPGMVERVMDSLADILPFDFIDVCLDIPHSQENTIVSVTPNSAPGEGAWKFRVTLPVFGYLGVDKFYVNGRGDALNGKTFLLKTASVNAGGQNYDVTFDLIEGSLAGSFGAGGKVRMVHFHEEGEPKFEAMKFLKDTLALQGRKVYCEPRADANQPRWFGAQGWHRLMTDVNWWVANPKFYTPETQWVTGSATDEEMSGEVVRVIGNGTPFLSRYITTQIMVDGHTVVDQMSTYRALGQNLNDVYVGVNSLLADLSGVGGEA